LSKWIKVAAKKDIPEGGGKVCIAGEKEIALFNVKGEFHAIDNFCRHRGGPLGEGTLENKFVSCPHHGWVFDVTTGNCVSRGGVIQEKYPVKVEQEEIFIEI